MARKVVAPRRCIVYTARTVTVHALAGRRENSF
jgi:hypothetical protein